MTFDVGAWETKHTKTLFICAIALAAVVFFHASERRWLAGALGLAAAVAAFTS